MPGLDIDELTKAFGQECIRQRQGGGGKMLDYLATHTVISRLNRFAGEWSWSINTIEVRGDLYVLTGTLTIPGLGSRDGIGVQRVSERGGEDLAKGCSSDALKKAATLFGVGLHLYGEDTEEEQEKADEQQRKDDAGKRFVVVAGENGWRLRDPETKKVDFPRISELVRNVLKWKGQDATGPMATAFYDFATAHIRAYTEAVKEEAQPSPGALFDAPQATPSAGNLYDREAAANRGGREQPNSRARTAQP